MPLKVMLKFAFVSAYFSASASDCVVQLLS